MNAIKYILLAILITIGQGHAFAQNVFVTNDAAHPVPVSGAGGGGGGAATIADGADVTQGAKADAKSTATDTTPITQMQVLKQISASVQAPPSQAVTNAGTFVVQNTPATATTVLSTALEASHVLKASAGSLVSLSWLNAKTTSQYLLIMNSTTVPADGAVTLLYPPIFMPATSNGMVVFHVPLAASTGISVSNSSTGTFTKTIGSADCVFSAQVY